VIAALCLLAVLGQSQPVKLATPGDPTKFIGAFKEADGGYALPVYCVDGTCSGGSGGGGTVTQGPAGSAPWAVIVDGGFVLVNQGAAGTAAWKVDGSGVTQPVSGTFWQATQPVSGPLTDTQLRASSVPVSAAQSGTWTVQPGNTANTTAWKVDGSAVTQPVSGTVAATESGTWTVQPGNTANTTPWLTTDSPATSATGSAVPAKAAYVGGYAAGNLEGLITCDKVAVANIVTATNTQLVAISGSTKVYVCSYAIEIQGVATTAGTLSLNYGTGSACATGTVQVTPAYVGSTTAGNPWSISVGSGLGALLRTTAGQAFCATSTTTTPIKVGITYAQF
jgi:hypothetical protein